MDPEFDEKSRRYRCLCGVVPAKVGTLIIGCVEVVLVIIFVIGAFGSAGLAMSAADNTADERETKRQMQELVAVSMSALLICIVVLVYLFLALKKEKSNYLLPHIVLRVVEMAILPIAIIGGIVGQDNVMKKNATITNKERTSTMGLAMTLGVVVIVVLELIFVWLLTIEVACYRYFKEKHVESYEFATTLPASQIRSVQRYDEKM